IAGSRARHFGRSVLRPTSRAANFLTRTRKRERTRPYLHATQVHQGDEDFFTPRSRTLFGNARPGNSVSRLSVCTGRRRQTEFQRPQVPKGTLGTRCKFCSHHAALAAPAAIKKGASHNGYEMRPRKSLWGL